MNARLLADLLIMRLGRPRLPWGSASESHTPSEVVRQKYLVALREADQGQIDGLIEFARS